jgi:uncharacterized protein YcnI
MRGIRRGTLVVGTLLTAVLVIGVGPAAAHVTVHSDDAVQGATDVAVMFRVPSEESHSSTVKLQVFFPITHPLLDVLVEPHPGWNYRVQTARLAQPVTTDDGQITDAVSEITWTARSSAAGLQPGEADDFTVTVGQLPDTPSVTFRALQSYSDGHVVRWIVSQAPGATEPEFPAPVLELAPSAGAAQPHQMSTTVTSSTGTSTKDDTSRTLAILALLVAIVAAWLAGAGLIRRR